MSENEQALRQQLEAAQARIAELEAALPPITPTPNSSTYPHFLDDLWEGYQVIGFDWRYHYVNQAAAFQGQRSAEDLLGHTMMECYPGIENTSLFAVLGRCMQERQPQQFENEFTYPDGSQGWFDLSIQPVPEGILILSIDSTHRKRTESALLERDKQMQLFVDYAPAEIVMFDNRMNYLLVSQRWLTNNGLPGQDVIGRSHYELFPHLPENWKAAHQRCLKGAVESSEADPFPRADGTLDWVSWKIQPWHKQDGSIGGIIIFSERITERRQAEERIRRLNRTLTVLSDVNQAIVRIHHLPDLYEAVCRIAVEKGGFRMAWVGLLDTSIGKLIPVAHAGTVDDYLDKVNITLSDAERGRGPAATALQSGEHVIVNDIEHDPRMAPWREDALRMGYRASAAFPLKVAGEVQGTFNLFMTETDYFDAEELRLLDEMAGDISFAMEFSQQDEQRSRAEEALQRYLWRLEVLHEIDRGIIQADSIPTVIETALRNIRQLIPCQRAMVYLFDYSTDEAVVFAVDIDSPTTLTQNARLPIPPESFQGFDGRHIKVTDDIRLIQPPNERTSRLVQEGVVSGLQVLLMDKEKPIGSLGLTATTPAFFTSEYQEIALQVASQLAIAIRQMRLSDEIRQSENLYRLLTENMADVVWVMDAQTLHFTYISPSVMHLRGYTSEEAMCV